MSRLLPILAFLLTTASLAQDLPIVRVDVSPAEVSVGEAVKVSVTVLGPTFFPKPPQFPSAELANTITRLPPNSSRPITQRVDGETWSGIVRNFEVYPLLGASYRLSGESIKVTYAQPGSIQGTTVDVPVPEITFRAVVPTGAESLDPYLAGRYLTLERQIEDEPESLEAGDALVVNYVAELDGLPAIFLPALVGMPETPGVSVYADQPIVEDTEPARRTEKYTFVFEAGGDFVIPGASLDWWNQTAGQIETTTVEPTTVSVTGEPLAPPEEEPPPAEPIDWRIVLVVLVLLYIARRLLSRFGPRLQAARAAARKKRLESEDYAFGQLQRALLGRDRRKAHAALLTWLERIAHGTSLADFAERYGDEKLRSELRGVSRTLYRCSSDNIHMKRLVLPLKRARRRAKQERKHHAEHALPPLNP